MTIFNVKVVVRAIDVGWNHAGKLTAILIVISAANEEGKNVRDVKHLSKNNSLVINVHHPFGIRVAII